ncbi:hypothetical protein [Sinomicrobium weinanense]|uniref:Uncharacterized protein n=1 Tax=Sinomicrobium weinanense TaxID=2842200 RepID=A0A926JRR8_9FLAO|nr:hypothetical protein [Sinomicrobium weinanense]MBC9796109.1 hypothetical protein [Sinomicrobium weinanense]MBU3124778.1 hypothetical protein [Sinomicrobium weinanense]
MPILHCFVKQKDVPELLLDSIVKEWGMRIGVADNDICINMVSGFVQAGKSYAILANLYLPALWSDQDVRNIQQSLLEVLSGNFHVREEDIFIMTSIIQSGHVVENGQIITW